VVAIDNAKACSTIQCRPEDIIPDDVRKRYVNPRTMPATKASQYEKGKLVFKFREATDYEGMRRQDYMLSDWESNDLEDIW
jgi:hypothetical protein